MIRNRNNSIVSLGAALVGLAVLWMGWLQNILSSKGFIPHGHCYLWKPGLVTLHAGSDIAIGLAYVAISATLAYLVHQTRREIPFHWMFLAFGTFIIACGFTHFLEVLTLWRPIYWLSGDLKLVTAIASILTALALPPLVPQAAALIQAAKMSEARRLQLETANQELEALYRKVKDLDQAKTQFFSTVSHELRTPLTLILGPTEKLLTAPNLTEEQHHYLELIAQNSHSLLQQVNDLLDIAKLETGKMAVHYQSVDLAHLLRTTTAQFEPIADDRQITFVVEAPTTLTAQVDPQKIQQVLLNLLSNAFKFTPKSGQIQCVLQETIVSETEVTQSQVVLRIQDSGAGVPLDQQTAIFDRFYAAPRYENDRFGSTGLGLAIVKEFVELHHGAISVSNVATGGACFTMTLPLTAPVGAVVQLDDQLAGESLMFLAPKVEDFQARTLPSTESRVASPSNQALVLVVEDNPDMNWFICETLATQYRVISAVNGQDGFKKAIDLEPDLIVSDVMMPVLDGEQLIQKLRTCPALEQTPVILLTAKNDHHLRVALLEQGAQDYLTKPFVVEELQARVKNLIAMNQVRRVLQKELVTQSQDVTALANELSLRKQDLQAALDALQVSEARFRHAILRAPFPAMIHAEDGSIISISDAWLTSTGYTREELQTISDWTERAYGSTKSQVETEISRLYALDDRLDEGEYLVTTATGAQRIWDFSSAFIGSMPDGRRLVVSMARDVTERNQLEQILRQQAEALVEANRLKDDFLATLSHELRTPMNSILGWATLLRSRQFDETTVSRALETIERNARQQTHLIEDLLKISRLIQGKFRLDTQPLNLALVVDAAVKAVCPAAEAKTIQLQLTIDSFFSNRLVPVLGDTDQLQQVIWNLLSNAVKFTPEGGRVDVRLEHISSEAAAAHAPAYAQLKIADTGMGIAPNFLPYVFDRFRQADSSLTRHHDGLGLGLAIVRHLVELHGGTVRADSSGEGQGAVFTVRLPLLQDKSRLIPCPIM